MTEAWMTKVRPSPEQEQVPLRPYLGKRRPRTGREASAMDSGQSRQALVPRSNNRKVLSRFGKEASATKDCQEARLDAVSNAGQAPSQTIKEKALPRIRKQAGAIEGTSGKHD